MLINNAGLYFLHPCCLGNSWMSWPIIQFHSFHYELINLLSLQITLLHQPGKLTEHQAPVSNYFISYISHGRSLRAVNGEDMLQTKGTKTFLFLLHNNNTILRWRWPHTSYLPMSSNQHRVAWILCCQGTQCSTYVNHDREHNSIYPLFPSQCMWQIVDIFRRTTEMEELWHLGTGSRCHSA
jgi:hypothetical protein